jgi:hypothetical protein
MEAKIIFSHLLPFFYRPLALLGGSKKIKIGAKISFLSSHQTFLNNFNIMFSLKYNNYLKFVPSLGACIGPLVDKFRQVVSIQPRYTQDLS